MKKIFALLLALLMLASVLAGCASEQVNNDTNPETKPDASANTDVNAKPAAEKAPEKSLKIVTTIFPEYDWVREVLGDQAKGRSCRADRGSAFASHAFQDRSKGTCRSVSAYHRDGPGTKSHQRRNA